MIESTAPAWACLSRARRRDLPRHWARTGEEFSGGIPYIVSGLKTLLETGQPLAAA